MTYYFVSYKNKIIGDNHEQKTISNVIIKDVHPLIWASRKTIFSGIEILTYIIFWQEIPEDVALNKKVIKYFPTEGYFMEEDIFELLKQRDEISLVELSAIFDISQDEVFLTIQNIRLKRRIPINMESIAEGVINVSLPEYYRK